VNDRSNPHLKDEDLDLLIAAAFDESDDPDAVTELEAANPAARRLRTEFAQMRLDLLKAADIPEPQISAERLRHAIENRAAKPKVVGWSWFEWTGALTLAACAIGLLVVAGNIIDRESRYAPASTGTTMATNAPVTESAPSEPVETNILPEGFTNTSTPDVPTNPPVAANNPTPRSETRPAPRRYLAQRDSRRNLDQALSGASRTVDRRSETLPPVGKTGAPMTLASEPEIAPMAAPMAAPVAAAPTPGRGEVVIVGMRQDPATGASEATEAPKRDVVFGG
jgi:hypothetical protein